MGIIEIITKYWVEWAMGIIASSVVFLWKKTTAEQKALKDGMKAILHDRIIEKCKTSLKVGEITPEDLDEIDYLNKPYMALGGNGTAKTMIEKVRELPMK